MKNFTSISIAMKTLLLYQFGFLFLAITFLAIPKVGAAEPAQLVNLRKGYVDAHVAAIEPITKKYYKALAELREKLVKGGNLEAALIVKSEENNNNKTEVSKQPRQLIALNRIYKQTTDRESAKVTTKYTRALKKLQDKLTRAGNLEGALKVKVEYQKYTAKERTSDQDRVKKFPNDIFDLKWYWMRDKKRRGETHFTLLKDGTGTFVNSQGPLTLSWKKVGSHKIMISLRHSGSTTLTWNSDISEFTGIDFDGKTSIMGTQ